MKKFIPPIFILLISCSDKKIEPDKVKIVMERKETQKNLKSELANLKSNCLDFKNLWKEFRANALKNPVLSNFNNINKLLYFSKIYLFVR